MGGVTGLEGEHGMAGCCVALGKAQHISEHASGQRDCCSRVVGI